MGRFGFITQSKAAAIITKTKREREREVVEQKNGQSESTREWVKERERVKAKERGAWKSFSIVKNENVDAVAIANEIIISSVQCAVFCVQCWVFSVQCAVLGARCFSGVTTTAANGRVVTCRIANWILDRFSTLFPKGRNQNEPV